MDRICLDALSSEERLSGPKVELPGMQRTAQDSAADQPIYQWSSTVGTVGLSGVDTTATGAKHGDLVLTHLEGAAFAEKDLGYRAKIIFSLRFSGHGRSPFALL
jgi:hypothetical protein